MSTPEGAHPRAKYNLHTGYREGQGGVVYPSIGSIVVEGTRHGRRPDAELRRHRRPQLRRRLPRAEAPAAARHRPEPRRRGPEGARRRPGSSTTASACSRRWRRRSTASTRPTRITDHKTTYERAVKLMQSKEAKAFDLSAGADDEPKQVRHRPVRRRRR